MNTGESDAKPKSRPLCVLLLWFTAKNKFARKYEAIYRQRGFDILSVHTTIFDIMFPGKLSERLMVELETSLANYDSLVVHSFSSGVLHFGAMLREIHRRQDSNNNNLCGKRVCEERGYVPKPLDERIKAMVFDCVIDFEIIAHGKTSKNTVFNSKLYKKFAKNYLKMFPQTNKFYTEVMDSVYKSYLTVPCLAFLTTIDHYNNCETIKNIHDMWRRNTNGKIDTALKYWDDCGHCQIYPKHPEEYLEQIDILLRKANLPMPV